MYEYEQVPNSTLMHDTSWEEHYEEHIKTDEFHTVCQDCWKELQTLLTRSRETGLKLVFYFKSAKDSDETPDAS